MRTLELVGILYGLYAAAVIITLAVAVAVMFAVQALADRIGRRT